MPHQISEELIERLRASGDPARTVARNAVTVAGIEAASTDRDRVIAEDDLDLRVPRGGQPLGEQPRRDVVVDIGADPSRSGRHSGILRHGTSLASAWKGVTWRKRDGATGWCRSSVTAWTATG